MSVNKDDDVWIAISFFAVYPFFISFSLYRRYAMKRTSFALLSLASLCAAIVFGMLSFSSVAMAGLFDDSESNPSRLYVADSFNDGIVQVAEQLQKGLPTSIKSKNLMIANFVALGNLNDTSPFGQLASANLIHEMRIRHWSVMDPLFTRDMYIGSNGEFALSRDAKKLPGALPSLEIIAGTYQMTSDAVVLNVRLIDAHTSGVISTAQVYFPRTQQINALIERPPVMPLLSLSN